MKSQQLIALKSAERLILAVITDIDSVKLSDAFETKRIVQRAIVDGELQPDLFGEMLAALKGVVAVADRKTVEFDRARDVIRRAYK